MIMAKATVKTSNFNKPAPRWYRVTKRIVYLITSSGITTGTLTRFGIPESDQLLIMGWLIFLMEVISVVLANGEEYSKSYSAPNDAEHQNN
jgi:hypothetical protein